MSGPQRGQPGPGAVERAGKRAGEQAGEARGWLPALTSIRFFAAIWVILAHFMFLIDFGPVVGLYLWAAKPTMTLFFILSGFIITYSYGSWFEQGDYSRIGTYYRARFARIAPMHVVALVLMTPVTLALGIFGPVTADNLDHLVASWVANLMALHIYIQQPGFDVWNQPAWTISTEIVFYALSPFLIAWMFRRLHSVEAMVRLAGVLFVVETLMLVGAMLFFHAMAERWNYEQMMAWVTFRWPFFRVWEFAIGCVIGVFVLRAPSLPCGRWATALLTSVSLRSRVLVVSLCVLAAMPPLVELARRWLYGRARLGLALAWEEMSAFVLYTPVLAVIILVLATGPTIASPVLAHPWLVRLGDATYSLYLLHWIPRQILKHTFGTTPASSGPQLWWSIIAIVACIPLSLLTYRMIELPAQRWLRRPTPRAAPRPEVALALAREGGTEAPGVVVPPGRGLARPAPERAVARRPAAAQASGEAPEAR